VNGWDFREWDLGVQGVRGLEATECMFQDLNGVKVCCFVPRS